LKRFLAFTAIGAVGFCVDGGILTALVESGTMNPYSARLVSFPIAVLVTWALNRQFAFSSFAASTKARTAEYGRYFSVQAVGATANLLVYGLCLFLWPSLGTWPVVPLAIGAVVGLVINFAGSKLWVFGPHRKPAR
jgi:putative flippase GtrA